MGTMKKTLGIFSSAVFVLTAAPSFAEAPASVGWQSSLEEIQKTTTQLLEINSQLSAENVRINTRASELGAQINAQKEKNKGLALAWEQRRSELEKKSNDKSWQQPLAQLEQAIAGKNAKVAELKANLKGIDAKLALRDLKIKELEIARKAEVLSAKDRFAQSASGIEREIKDFERDIESYSEQEKMVRTKIQALPPLDPAVSADVARLSGEIKDLKEKVLAASRSQEELSEQAGSLDSQMLALQSQPLVQKMNSQRARKNSLEKELEGTQARLKELSGTVEDQADMLIELRKKADAADAEVKNLKFESENLRENVAILDYKIHSLRNYQNRGRGR